MNQQLSPEQAKQLEEKLKNMSPEELKAFYKQQCIFCQIIDGKIPAKKIYEDDKCIAFLDINPAHEGHVLLLPKEHYSVGPQVPDDLMQHMGTVVQKLSQACLQGVNCKGTTIYTANGPVAGQQAQHFMFHIVPRSEDDGLANFNIPENKADKKEIDELAKNIKEFIEKLKEAQDKPQAVETKLEEEQAPEATPKQEEKKETSPEQKGGADLDAVSKLFG